MQMVSGLGRLGAFSNGVGTVRHALASSLSGASLQLAVARRRLETGQERPAAESALSALDRAEEGVVSGGRLLDVLGALAELHAGTFGSFPLLEALNGAMSRYFPGEPVPVREEGGAPDLLGPRGPVEEALGELTRLALPYEERESWPARRAEWSVDRAGATLAFAGSLPARPDRLFALGSFPRATELFLANAAVGAAGGAIELTLPEMSGKPASAVSLTLPDMPGKPASAVSLTLPDMPGKPASAVSLTLPDMPGKPASAVSLTLPDRVMIRLTFGERG